MLLFASHLDGVIKCGPVRPIEIVNVMKGIPTHLDDLLHRDDVASMSQAYWLVWSQTLVALFHNLNARGASHPSQS